MARTDALAVEGLDAAIDRACACVDAGADMIFPEAITDLAMYKRFAAAVKVPSSPTSPSSARRLCIRWTNCAKRRRDRALTLCPHSAR
jgi:2-methylisocitrate lyase-like PEP mutase family enzyme